MTIKRLVIVLVAVVSFTGCDVAEMVSNQAVDTTVYLPPAIELQISVEEVAVVHGYDDCPQEAINWWGSPPVKVYTKSCVKLEPDTNQIKVGLQLEGQYVIETWLVEHTGDAVTLARENGFQIREPSK
ncbi:hypothetical protein OH460_08680 [Vibrio sp. Makdt]|uniref:hypothetical protein n=1 Tax=Vibrio sp. Makdt TaxID=2998828 RepID=UPI0022CD95B5|nr:hypothetical protein [Vibrio sp. Makdt]MDA0152376.1 hypothetical protein [Vibrio sp. Makdt]